MSWIVVEAEQEHGVLSGVVPSCRLFGPYAEKADADRERRRLLAANQDVYSGVMPGNRPRVWVCPEPTPYGPPRVLTVAVVDRPMPARADAGVGPMFLLHSGQYRLASREPGYLVVEDDGDFIRIAAGDARVRLMTPEEARAL